MNLRIAHFPDLHLNIREGPGQKRYLDALIDHALSNEVQHFIITGDISDCADAEDFKAVRHSFETKGLLRSDKLSVVPGNHDLWGHPQKTGLRMFKSRKFYADNKRSFFDAFRESYDGDLIFPIFKKVSGVEFVLMNSVDISYRLAGGAAGDLSDTQLGILGDFKNDGREHLRIGVMHHHLLQRFPDGDLIESPVGEAFKIPMMNFVDLPKILRAFDGVFDIVVHGHLHKHLEYRVCTGTMVFGCGVGKESYHIYDLDTMTSSVETTRIYL